MEANSPPSAATLVAVLDEDGKPGEACGVFGVYAPGSSASLLTYFGLFALQHRGQESAGICASDGETATVFKELGLVPQVFNEEILAALEGPLAIGHTRYSTTGSPKWQNAQPVFRQVEDRSLALAHNGNLTNTMDLAAEVDLADVTDTEVLIEHLAIQARQAGPQFSLVEALTGLLPRLEGAFSLVVMDQRHVIGVRDPHGFRPLCLGRLENGWVLASETAALDIVGAEFVREVEPGEMVEIGEGGVRSFFPFTEISPRLCVFEFVYFARPDSRLHDRYIHGARLQMGRILAAEQPVEADVVVPVPESGIPAAQGFSAASGIPYADGLVKNRYVGRTFIEPTQLLRDRGIRVKLNPIRSTLEGQRVVLVDDSIVRGSTTRKLVEMVRQAGAQEVHLRISSPPYRNPCFYGMDTSDSSKLLAAHMSVEEIADHIDADTLGYLSLAGLLDATGSADRGFCTACLSGVYPTEIPDGLTKFSLEHA